jgi:CubicO group peptidase (beta-lactamase class C family)
MTSLRALLERTVESGRVPGAAALVARGEDVEVAGVGEVEPESIARIASITKPITAAAVMILVDQGLVALDDPVARWLPELASPQVVRTLQSAIDDVVPAARPVTVEDVLTFRGGWGFPSDFSLPAVVELFQKLPVFGARETPDEWLGTLAQVPMLRQPGEAWLYNTCSDIQGVLIARVSGGTAAGVPRRAHLRATRNDRHQLPCPLGEARPAAAIPRARFRADRRRTLDRAADLPVGRR